MKKTLFILLLSVLLSFSNLIQVMAMDEPYEIIIENDTYGDIYKDIAAVEQAINEILLPKINCTIQIKNYFIDDSEAINQRMFQNKEKSDLVYSLNLATTMEWVSKEYLLPLNELLQDHGQEILDLFGAELTNMQIDGNLYALPTQPGYAKAGGIIYNAEIADKYNITIPDNITLEDLNVIFEELHTKVPGLYATTQGFGKVNLFEYFFNAESFGYRYMNCGIILDPDSSQIQNFYSTQECLNYYKMLRAWVEKGYMSSDTMTSNQVQQNYLLNGDIFCLPVYYTPLTMSIEQRKYPFEIGVAQITDALCTTSSIWKPIWAISYTSENPEKVMEFLNLMYTDTEISNLLSYGIEGIHYSKITDHVIQPILSADGTQTYQNQVCQYGDATKMLHWYPATEETNNSLQEFFDSASHSKTLGYTFDITPVQLQFTAVNDILELYIPPLECGMVEDVDSAIDTLQIELEKAGITDIVSENQRQLNKWLAAQ